MTVLFMPAHPLIPPPPQAARAICVVPIHVSTLLSGKQYLWTHGFWEASTMCSTRRSQ
jgi:hypothetical protein